MSSSCIITDSAAQLPKKLLTSSKDIGIIPYSVLKEGEDLDVTQLKISQLPEWISPAQTPTLLEPREDEIAAFMEEYQQRYDDLFLIVASGNLFPAYPVVEKIAARQHGRAKIHLIDSQSISIGEGLLIQRTHELIQQNLPADLIEEELRQIIPHIFTLLSTSNFSYLHKYGFLDRGQSIAGEMLSVLPILSLDNGKLNPLEKIKNIRALIDYSIEFIDEFDNLDTVSFILPEGAPIADFRGIKQYIEEEHPEAKYFEYPINSFLATLIGPRGMGLVIQEKLL